MKKVSLLQDNTKFIIISLSAESVLSLCSLKKGEKPQNNTENQSEPLALGMKNKLQA